MRTSIVWNFGRFDFRAKKSKLFHTSPFLSRKFLMHNATHQLFSEMRHFLTVCFFHFQRWRLSFFLAISKTWKCEMRNSCRSKTSSSIEDTRFLKFRNRFKAFLPFSKEEVRNGEVFVEHSQFRVREKRMQLEHSQSTTSLIWPKHVFECALPSWKSPHLARFRTFLWDIDYRLLRNSF